MDSRVLPKLRLKRDRFDIDPEVTLRVARLGLRIREVPIRYVPRRWREGKKIGWFDAIEALATTARLTIWG